MLLSLPCLLRQRPIRPPLCPPHSSSLTGCPSSSAWASPPPTSCALCALYLRSQGPQSCRRCTLTTCRRHSRLRTTTRRLMRTSSRACCGSRTRGGASVHSRLVARGTYRARSAVTTSAALWVPPWPAIGRSSTVSKSLASRCSRKVRDEGTCKPKSSGIESVIVRVIDRAGHAASLLL